MSGARFHFARPAFFAASVAHLFPLSGVVPAIGQEAGAAGALPFPAALESVVERGAIEGHPVSVLRVRTALDVDEAVTSTRRAWGAQRADAVVVTRTGPWQVVSARERSGFRTLQLRAAPDGGSEGLLSVWADRPSAVHERGPALDASQWLPAGAQVLRRVDGVDGNRRHRTVVALVDGSVSWVVAALEARVLARGFVSDRTGHRTVGTAQSRLYRAPGRDLAFTAHSQEGRVAIVIHLTEPAP